MSWHSAKFSSFAECHDHCTRQINRNCNFFCFLHSSDTNSSNIYHMSHIYHKHHNSHIYITAKPFSHIISTTTQITTCRNHKSNITTTSHKFTTTVHQVQAQVTTTSEAQVQAHDEAQLLKKAAYDTMVKQRLHHLVMHEWGYSNPPTEAAKR